MLSVLVCFGLFFCAVFLYFEVLFFGVVIFFLVLSFCFFVFRFSLSSSVGCWRACIMYVVPMVLSTMASRIAMSTPFTFNDVVSLVVVL